MLPTGPVHSGPASPMTATCPPSASRQSRPRRLPAIARHQLGDCDRAVNALMPLPLTHRRTMPTARWPFASRPRKSAGGLCTTRRTAVAPDDDCKCGRYGNEVDHIQPLDRGGEAYAPSNLQMLCRGCHILKSAKENCRQPTPAESRPGGSSSTSLPALEARSGLVVLWWCRH